MVQCLVGSRTWLETAFLSFDRSSDQQASVSLSHSDCLSPFLQQLHVFAIVGKVTGGTTTRPVLQTISNHRLIVLVIAGSEGVNGLFYLLLATDLGLDRVQLVLLVVYEAWIVALLGHLGKVTTFAKAHGRLLVVLLHVRVECLRLLERLAVDLLQDVREAVTHRIRRVNAAVLNG